MPYSLPGRLPFPALAPVREPLELYVGLCGRVSSLYGPQLRTHKWRNTYVLWCCLLPGFLNPALLLGFVASFCFVARNRRAQPLGIPVVAEKGVKRTPEDEEKGEEALASARYAERPIRSVVECAPGICVEIKKVRVESKPVRKMRLRKRRDLQPCHKRQDAATPCWTAA